MLNMLIAAPGSGLPVILRIELAGGAFFVKFREHSRKIRKIFTGKPKRRCCFEIKFETSKPVFNKFKFVEK